MRAWVRFFLRSGHDVLLITYHDPDKVKDIEGLTTHRIPYNRGRSLNLTSFPRVVLKMRGLIRKMSPDVLHAHYVLNYGLCGAVSGFHPLVTSAWGDDIAIVPERSRTYRYLVMYALAKADVVHTWDEVGRKRLMELGREDGVLVRPWGVDTDQFSPMVGSRKLERELRDGRQFAVICTRRWEPLYHVDLLISSVPHVIRQVPSTRFVLLGGGPLECELRRLAKKLEVQEHIVFLGNVPYDDVATYLASADVYVDTSSDIRNDGTINQGGSGIGVGLIEAMSCGTAPVVSDRMSIAASKDYKGLMYKQMDPKDMSDRIVTLLKNEELRRQVGETSREISVRSYDLNQIMKEWERLYQELKKGETPI